MSYKANAPNSISAGALPHPAGLLTVLPRPLSWVLKILLLRERKRGKGERKKWGRMELRVRKK